MEEVAESLQDIKEQKRVLLISKLKKGNVSNSAIKKRDNGKVAPLSYAQEPLWLMSQLEPENPIYNVAGGLEFSGVLNTETLHQSLNETIRRHEILQSRFVNEQGIVAQQVSDDSQLQLAHVDISQIDAKLRQAHFDQIAEEFISKPFNLINNPPLRGMLVTFGNQKHILVLTLHHIVADRWSVGILMQEVAALYKSYVIGLPSVLPELTIQYGDFAVWQKEQLEVSREKNSEYWQQKLEHAPPTLTLPLDYIRPSVPSYRGDLYQFEFSSSLSQAIKSLAKRNKATLFMTMAAIINILLSRYSGSRDIVLGYTSAGRNQAQTENLIGYFINTLVLRNQLDNDDSFISLLNRIQNQALLDQDHQDISFSQLKEAAGETGSKNEGRLFQVMLTVQNAPMSEFHLPGLTVKPIALENQVSQFDLTFLVEEQEGSLFGAIEYSTDLFETAILDRLVGHLKTLCEAIVVHPDKPIGQLEILTKPEWQQLVFDWNKPCKLERASEQDKPITSWIASKAETNPSAVALVFAEEKITYWELNTRANRLAHYLQIQGLGTETRIGIFAERSIEMVVAILAVLKSGAAYVPLDPSYPTERLIYMVKDVGAQLILTQLSLSNKLNFGNIPVALIDESYEDYPSEPPIQTATLDNTAYIIFTSGSSGQPKGVMVSHRNLLHSTLARLDYYQDVPECFLLISSFAFDSSVAGIFWTLSQGGCLCLPKNEETGNPAALAVLIKNHRVTHLLALPSFYKAIINDNATPSLTSLTTVIVAGEACSSEIANEHHGKLPDVKLYNEYGPTEATVWSSSYKVEKNEPVRTLPIGKVLNHGQIYLLDSHYQPVPIGVCGELYIGGLGISQGYVNRPDLTAERFIPDLFTGSGGRLYKTGDLARFRSDGNIEFIGRIDHQVKIRGYRVELEEIEVKLVACSGVRDAVVIVREDNEGDKRIVAYLIAEHDLVINDLRNQLPNALPEYMLPSAFVILDALPLTPNGKLDRKALPAPGLSDVAIQDFLPPQGAAEIILAKIWQELLAVERVGRNDHFFELGGHSLMAISLIEKLQQHEFAVDLMNVFNMPVLAELAASLSDLSEAKKFDVPSNLIPSNCTHITPDMLPLVTLSQTEIDSIASHVSGGMANIQDIYPLAPLQEGIFFHHLLNRENDTYIKRSVLGFDSRNRLDSFLNALQTVINRHDILRTAFHWEGISQSVQVVQRQASLPVIELDLIGIANTDDICAKLLKETDPRNIRLNLRQAPLFVAYIAFDHQLNQWLMSIINHHLIDDNYTLQLILSEIQKIIQGQGDKLPDSIPYRNFIVKALAVSPAEHESYFNAQLGDISEPTAPYRILDIQNNNRQVSEVKIQLNNALSQRIYDSATQHGVTPALLFHVAWGKVLGQCTGHDVVVFGTVLSGRLQGSEGVSQVLGMFINTLPLRVDLNSRSVKEVVNDTHHRLISLLDHEQASLALAQRCSAVDASLPLFTTLLNYRHTNLIVSQNNDSTDIFEWGGVQIFHSEERTNYPITVNVDDLSQGFSLTVQCVEEIDPERIAAYLNTAVAQLVDALSQTPEIPIGRLSILPAPERDQLLHGFNATNADYPQHRCIHDLFEAQAEANPAAIALIYEGESLSYGELNRHANRLAHHLISLGIRPDDRVAICVERSLEMVIGLLAILKAGGCYVPLDPGYPEGRLAYMLADSAPLAILTQSGLKARLPGLSASLEALGIPAVLLDGEGQGVRPAGEATNAQTDSIGDTNQKDSLSLLCVGHPEHNPDPAQLGLTSHHLAYVIYTSGSTGQPKGVMVEHKSIIRLVINSGYAPITSNDCVAHCASPVFDASIWEIWAPLLNGAKLLLIPQQILLNPTQLNKELIKGKVTALWLTVGLFNNYVEDLKEALNQLKYLLVGGDVLDPKIIKALLNGSNVPRKILNGYGPTETTTFASTHHIVTIEDETISIPIGRPIANTQIYILDRHLQPVPLGVTGEIHIGGAGVARGYLNRPELTAERFIADPFGQGRDNLAGAACGGRLYKTGDLGRWLPDGSVDYLGRNDFQVKIRGFRIELGEVEAQLSRCPGIREAVVMAREDVPGDKRLVAYLVAEAGQEPTAADLRGQLSAVLAEYMVPGAYVALEAFPLTPNGKLDRKALPAPDGSSVTCRAYEPPQGAAEAAIAHIWQELLHLGQVGRHDHFFELGGHSLLAVQLVSRLRQELGIEVPLRDLFARPVLAGFARAVTNARQSELPPIQMADRSQPIPLSWAQQRLWFLGQLDPAASAAYHIPAGLRLHGRLDKAALKASLDRIVARHEILRTSFISQDGQAFQHIAPAHGGFALAAHDLSGLSKRKQRTAVQQTAADEASQAFDLSTGPLIRGQLLELGADEHILLITQHHIISDGWSIGLLVQEFAALYAAFSQGQPDPLPDLAVQYADYAAWQRQWLQGDTLQAQTAFWQSHLTGAPAMLELPTDRPRPTTQSYAGGSVGLELSKQLSADLKHLAQRHGSTLFMVLLAGWSILMARLSGLGDIVIGTPIANRQRSEVEPLIGFFVNTLALRVRLDDNPSVAALLNRVKATTLDAYGHQDIPFEQVVDLVKPERSLGHSPVFQVMLAMDNTPGTGELALPGLNLSGLELAHTTTHFELSLFLTDREEHIAGILEYASELFDKVTIERFKEYYQLILVGMVTNAQQRIGQLPFLPEAERHQLLHGFNATAAGYPHQRCVHELFEGQALANPAATALVYEGESLSYGELNRHANRLAHRLIGLGIRPDDRVAICAERGLEMVVGLLGILKAGGCYVPLDPGYPEERLAYMLTDSSPSAILTQSGLKARLPGLGASPVPVVLLGGEGREAQATGEATGAAGLDGLCAGHPEHNPVPARLGLSSRHLAYVIYTSGSTGQPKCVGMEHSALVNLLQWQSANIKSNKGQITLQFAALGFDVAFQEIFSSLCYGECLLLINETVRHDFYLLTEILAEYKVQKIFLPTIALQGLAEVIININLNLPCLVDVITAGEQLRITKNISEFIRQVPFRRLHNHYGPTETHVVTSHTLNHDLSTIFLLPPIGRPIANTQIYILDGHLQPVPLGVTGEIYIGGAGVARGYLGRPGLTAERFIA
ncbi:MAG: amino acid adenylation domain-containing protein, partial [Methyloglobulus sp.]|nr:amino acid adenylation domain-containing protein [Methyloglobulus sp.]